MGSGKSHFKMKPKTFLPDDIHWIQHFLGTDWPEGLGLAAAWGSVLTVPSPLAPPAFSVFPLPSQCFILYLPESKLIRHFSSIFLWSISIYLVLYYHLWSWKTHYVVLFSKSFEGAGNHDEDDDHGLKKVFTLYRHTSFYCILLYCTSQMLCFCCFFFFLQIEGLW